MYERATPARTQLANRGDQRQGGGSTHDTQTKAEKKRNDMHEGVTPTKNTTTAHGQSEHCKAGNLH